MPSSFTWLDYSERERRKMLDIIRMLGEQGILDELGIGTIRDAFADAFFPGINTLQTHARYYLFVPWIYRQLEERKVSSARIREEARRQEVQLIFALDAAEDKSTPGIIGRDSRSELQRLPSNIYWLGLRAWGIRSFPGSQDEYHRYLDRFYAAARYVPAQARGTRAPKDTAEEYPTEDRLRRNWHGGLPPAPEGFPKAAALALTREESEYLRERLQMQQPASLLAFLVARGKCAPLKKPLWQHPQVEDFPESARHLLDHARHFSLAMFGAVLLYNLFLARESGKRYLIENYKDQFERWAAEADADRDALRTWKIDVFWGIVLSLNRRVTPATRSFVNSWLTLVSPCKDLGTLPEDTRVQTMIRNRERQLKGARSRFTDRRALEVWSGASGVYRLDYRWGVAQVIVEDVLRGFGEDRAHARA